MNLDQLRVGLLGTWRSIAPEVRPSRNPDGTIKPFFLGRRFVYHENDRFELTVTTFADAFGKAKLATIEIAGHMTWRGDHPSARRSAGRLRGRRDLRRDAVAPALRRPTHEGCDRWLRPVEGRRATERLRQAVRTVGLAKGAVFLEYDLVHPTSWAEVIRVSLAARN